MRDVEVVITNWKRPANVKRIIERFRAQSIDCALTICEAGQGEFALESETLKEADNVYRFRENYGPFTRFIPSANYTHKYTYFHDDDMLPGVKAIEHFTSAMEHFNEAAALGQIGRLVREKYDGRNVPRQEEAFIPVDMLVRGYCVRSEELVNLTRFQRRLGIPHPREDDMVLALAIHAFSDRKIFLTPTFGDVHQLMNVEELPCPHALSTAGRHYSDRDSFWKRGIEIVRAIRGSNCGA